VPSGGASYLELRAQALDAVTNGLLPAPGADHPRVSGVVFDVRAKGGEVTFVCLTDDTTSMYTSAGGGTIGAGSHAPVAEATHALLAAVDHQLDDFIERDDRDTPPPGVVRFHVLTPTGARTGDVPEDCFWGHAPHAWSPVLTAAQHVLTTMHEASSG
jgi:hypothetical protein